MKDTECVEFLQWSLPRLRLRWSGFRKVRKQVCKRLGRRLNTLGLADLSAYRAWMEMHPGERQVLDSLCRITISRFYRDRGVFDALCKNILPSLAGNVLRQGGEEVRCWSAGCGSGEEPYTMRILWKSCVLPASELNLPLRIVATDVDPESIKRARKGCYNASSIRELPEKLRYQAFTSTGDYWCIHDDCKEDIEFLEQDIRVRMPPGSFHIILCRNLCLTYFEETLTREIIERALEKLVPGGIFIIGVHETLPHGLSGLVPFGSMKAVFQKLNEKLP